MLKWSFFCTNFKNKENLQTLKFYVERSMLDVKILAGKTKINLTIGVVMFVLHINAKVKHEFVEEFKQVCIENAKNSIKEPGVKRFDVLQQSDDPTKFVLVEAYLDESGVEQHKKTAHYNNWRKEAERMVDGERIRTRYVPVWPEVY